MNGKITRQAIVVVTALGKDLANEKIKEFFPYSDVGDWLDVPLSPDGLEPITHYWCSVMLTERVIGGLMYELEALPEQQRQAIHVYFDTDPQEVLDDLGLQRISV